MIKKYGTLFIALVLSALGISLTMKAAVGLSAFDAITQTLSLATGIRVGNILMIIYVIFILLQLYLLKEQADWTLFLQLPLTVILGQFINFFVYGVLENITINSYLVNILLLIFAQSLLAFSIAIILLLDIVSMPIERFSLLFANQKNYTFGKVRQGFDILFIGLSLILTFVFSLPFTIREGTIISAFVFGPLMDFFMNALRSPFRKMELIK